MKKNDYKSKINLVNDKRNNLILYPIYKMVSWDLLFYYAIIFIFLTTTKGYSASEVMFINATYPLFKIIFQIPCTTIVDKIGKKNSLVIGNCLLSLSIFTLMFSTNMPTTILFMLLQAIAFTFKSLTESNILYDSTGNRIGRNIFATIEQKGCSYYYYFDGIASLLTGFLYVVNEYIPIVITFIFTLVSIVLSLLFKDVYHKENKRHKNSHFISNMNNYIKELHVSFKLIFTSKRLRALFLFSTVFSSFIYFVQTYRESLLIDINVPAQYFSMIFAILTFISGIGASRLKKLTKIFKNKILSVISLTYFISCIIISLAVIFNLNTIALFAIVFTGYVLHYLLEGPYYTLNSIYLKNYTTAKIRTKITSAYDLIICVTQAIMSLFASFILSITTTSKALLFLSIFYVLILFLVLKYMKTRIGLRPEQYDKKDIELTV